MSPTNRNWCTFNISLGKRPCNFEVQVRNCRQTVYVLTRRASFLRFATNGFISRVLACQTLNTNALALWMRAGVVADVSSQLYPSMMPQPSPSIPPSTLILLTHASSHPLQLPVQSHVTPSCSIIPTVAAYIPKLDHLRAHALS